MTAFYIYYNYDDHKYSLLKLNEAKNQMKGIEIQGSPIKGWVYYFLKKKNYLDSGYPGIWKEVSFEEVVLNIFLTKGRAKLWIILINVF